MGAEVYSGRHILQWHITHRCNLRCRHCYQADYACEMSPDALREALARYERFLKAEGLQAQINLTGGEPLAHPDFFSLAEEIRRHGHRFAVLTNGTMVDAEAARQLALLKPEFVQVSLDGTERVHDRIRGRGSFLRAAEGIDRLKARGVPVQVSFTAQRENRRSLPALALFCRAHGVDKLWFDRVVIPAEEDTGHLSLSGEEFRQLVRTARRLERFTPLRCVRSLQFADDAESGLYHCCAGGSLLILLADGTLMPCRRLPDVIGNIFDGELKDTLQNSETMRALRDAPIPAACAGCAHAERCRSGAKCITCAKTGRLLLTVALVHAIWHLRLTESARIGLLGLHLLGHLTEAMLHGRLLSLHGVIIYRLLELVLSWDRRSGELLTRGDILIIVLIISQRIVDSFRRRQRRRAERTETRCIGFIKHTEIKLLFGVI